MKSMLQQVGIVDRDGAVGPSLIGFVAAIILLPAIYYIFKMGDWAAGSIGVFCFGYLAYRIYRSYRRVDVQLPLVFAWASMLIAGILFSDIGAFAQKEGTLNIEGIAWPGIQRIGYLLFFTAVCFLLGPVLFGHRYFGIGPIWNYSNISSEEGEKTRQ